MPSIWFAGKLVYAVPVVNDRCNPESSMFSKQALAEQCCCRCEFGAKD